MKIKWLWLLLAVMMILAACDDADSENPVNNSSDNDAPVSSSLEDVPQRPEGLQTAKVERVVDGDTLELSGGRRVRLIGINTPEQGEYLYEAASAYTRELLQGKDVGLEPGAEAVDQFGRELFYVWIGDKLANYEIIRAGYANSYAVPPNVQYKVFFDRAAESSAADNLGIWRRGQEGLKIDLVVANPPGRDEENLNGELVRIVNTSADSIEMVGFTLRDDGANVYTFGDFALEPNRSITVYSGCGVVSLTSLYWCSDLPIWNNSGDTVYLNDASGLYVDRYVIQGQ